MKKQVMLRLLESEMIGLKNTTHMAQYSFAISILKQIDEPEKLYKVVFPFTGTEEKTLIKNRITGSTWNEDIEKNKVYAKENFKYYFTEQEIKEIDGRFLPFAEPVSEQDLKLALPKIRQVLVKFFDSQEYRTELTEDAARELIEFLEANKK